MNNKVHVLDINIKSFYQDLSFMYKAQNFCVIMACKT